jgi:biotin-[acetyl-CoA-carboxylase] ligase BirA-like protein
MHILTDCPDECDHLQGEPALWKQTDGRHGDWGDLWSAVSDDTSLWTTQTSRLGTDRSLTYLVVIDRAEASQFDALLTAVHDKRSLPPGAAVIALEGRSFHGLRGRVWTALRGNVHLSVFYPIEINVSDARGALTMLPAIAVVDAVRALCGEDVVPGIKWVNDILVEGKKVAGVLTNTQLQGSKFCNVVFGIGLNVEVGPEIEPGVFVPAATCLNAFKGASRVRMIDILWALLDALDGRLSTLLSTGYEPILDAYREYSIVLGREVRIWKESTDDSPGALMSKFPFAFGTVDAIEADLGLRIRGRDAVVRSGRLAFEDVCRSFGL